MPDQPKKSSDQQAKAKASSTKRKSSSRKRSGSSSSGAKTKGAVIVRGVIHPAGTAVSKLGLDDAAVKRLKDRGSI